MPFAAGGGRSSPHLPQAVEDVSRGPLGGQGDAVGSATQRGARMLPEPCAAELVTLFAFAPKENLFLSNCRLGNWKTNLQSL